MALANIVAAFLICIMLSFSKFMYSSFSIVVGVHLTLRITGGGLRSGRSDATGCWAILRSSIARPRGRSSVTRADLDDDLLLVIV